MGIICRPMAKIATIPIEVTLLEGPESATSLITIRVAVTANKPLGLPTNLHAVPIDHQRLISNY